MAFNLIAALRLNDVNFTRGMRNARRSMSGLSSGTSELVKGLGLVTTAAAGVGAAFLSVNKAMDFESQMSTIKALTGATNAEMAQMQKLALDMGASTKYSALEAGRGIEELLKAGLSPAAVKAGALEAGLNLATAGGLELAEAAEIMSTALNAFKKDAMTASEASNILAGTANASATDVHDLKYSLSMVSAVAAGIGLSFKDTNAALGVFANNGLKGSDAGTSLKTLLLNLSPITKNQAKEFAALGITTKDGGNQFFDAAGNIKDMAGIAGVLQKQLKGLTNEQRQATLKTMFGTDAIRAANILYNEGAEGIKKFQKEMSKVTALDVAKEKMNNASGAVEQFKGAMETLQIAVLLPLMPVIKDAANRMADFIANLKPEQIKSWGDNIKDAAQSAIDFAKFIYDHWVPIRETIIGITVAIVAFRASMLTLMIVGTITKLIAAYRAGTLAATMAQMGLNGALLANPIGLVIAALAALVAIGVVVYRNFDVIKAKVIQLWPTLRSLLGPIGDLIQAGINLKNNWTDVWTSIKQGAADAVNGVIGKINAMIEAINLIPGVKIPVVAKVDWGATNPNTAGYSQGGTSASTYGYSQARGKSHASGLSNVPYNGYQATLHKGERVLTPEENATYKNGGKGGNTINLTVNYQATGHTEQDAMNLLGMITRLIEREGAMA